MPWFPQPFQGKLPFLLHSGGKAGRFLPASCFLPGLALCWGAVPWLPPTQGCGLVQQICSTDSLAQKDLLHDLLEPASLLVYSFKEKKVLMLSVSVKSLASVVCLQRSLVEQTSYINSFCGKPPCEVHWSLSIIFINSMTTVLEFYHHYHSSITKGFRQITVQDHGHFPSKISHTKSTDLKCKWSQEPGNCRNRNGSSISRSGCYICSPSELLPHVGSVPSLLIAIHWILLKRTQVNCHTSINELMPVRGAGCLHTRFANLQIL